MQEWQWLLLQIFPFWGKHSSEKLYFWTILNQKCLCAPEGHTPPKGCLAHSLLIGEGSVDWTWDGFGLLLLLLLSWSAQIRLDYRGRLERVTSPQMNSDALLNSTSNPIPVQLDTGTSLPVAVSPSSPSDRPSTPSPSRDPELPTQLPFRWFPATFLPGPHTRYCKPTNLLPASPLIPLLHINSAS